MLVRGQDNDISTSWTCDGSTTRNGDCEIELDLSWYRHLKEVNIGKPCRSHVRVAINLHKFSTDVKSRKKADGEKSLDFGLFMKKWALSQSTKCGV